MTPPTRRSQYRPTESSVNISPVLSPDDSNANTTTNHDNSNDNNHERRNSLMKDDEGAGLLPKNTHGLIHSEHDHDLEDGERSIISERNDGGNITARGALIHIM